MQISALEVIEMVTIPWNMAEIVVIIIRIKWKFKSCEPSGLLANEWSFSVPTKS